MTGRVTATGCLYVFLCFFTLISNSRSIDMTVQVTFQDVDLEDGKCFYNISQYTVTLCLL